jgi:ribosomal protein S27E
VLAGYEITIVAAYDPMRTIFSGWTEGHTACTTLASSTAPGGTRAECHFAATSQDRTFNVTFATAPPATEILRVQLSEPSSGNGVIFSSPTLVSCTVQGAQILNATGGICNYSIAHGDTIIVTGSPAIDGSTFVGWQGCDSQPATNQCSVTMNAFRTITATFRR